MGLRPRSASKRSPYARFTRGFRDEETRRHPDSQRGRNEYIALAAGFVVLAVEKARAGFVERRAGFALRAVGRVERLDRQIE